MKKLPRHGKTISFEALWDDYQALCKKAQSPLVQDPDELRYLSTLAQKKDTYLEVGTSFGGTLWVVGHYLNPGARVVGIDLPKVEPNKAERNERLRQCVDLVCRELQRRGINVSMLWTDSHAESTVNAVRYINGRYDLAFIDGDHTYHGVKQDLENYGKMSDVMVAHDLCLPDVNQAFQEYRVGHRSHAYGKKFRLGILEN